ncbi:MAG: hypothetical protein P4L46_22210 [Fimbriimonas sp.]|nr:hypothetical protein [Fimbriimonas sp.]
MAREIGAFKEKTVGCLMVIGLLVIVLSSILLWTFSVAGIYRGTYTRTPITNEITDAGSLNWAPLAILGIVVGVLMVGGGIGYGLWTAVSQNKGPRRTEPNFRVLARYCYDRSMNLITAEWDIDAADRPKFYVRGVFQDGSVCEFETTEQVYYQAGEGMTGEAEVQGKWLGRFVPYIGVPPASADPLGLQ